MSSSKNIDLTKDLETAIEAKMVQEQEAAKAKFTQQKAQIEADTVVIKAKGDAESIRIRGEALKQTPAFIDLQIVEKWDGKAPLVVNGSGAGSANILLPLSDLEKAAEFGSQTMNPRNIAIIKIASLCAAVLGMVLIFPKALGFVEMGAREVRYLWWMFLLLALAAWLIWGTGQQEEIGLRRLLIRPCAGLSASHPGHERFRDFHVQNIFIARHIEHHIQHQPLEQGCARARAGAFLDRLGGQFAKRIRREFQLHSLHRHQLGVLLRERVFLVW